MTPAALAIIPARGGSRGVPRKNLRTIGGDPLVVRTIFAALEAGVDRVVVSTDDPEIASVSRRAGALVVDRPARLSGSGTTVAEVVVHVLDQLGVADGTGPIVVLQPTSPFTTADLIQAVLIALGGSDSIATVSPIRHGLWTADGPVHRKSVNRQDAEPHAWLETGAVVAVREFPATGGPLPGNPLVGAEHVLFDPDAEADWISTIDSERYGLDIDTPTDFAMARHLTSRASIVFRVAAGVDTGSGHLHRCLTLADELTHHEIRFQFTYDWEPWAEEMVSDRGYYVISETRHLMPVALTVFDCLEHLTPEDVLTLRAWGGRTVVLECLNPAVVAAADLAVNSLYTGPAGALTGPAWEPLRPEFALPSEPWERPAGVGRVLVSFGGTDPSRLTERFAAIPASLGYDTKVLWPPGRGDRPADGSCWEGSVSDALDWCDVAITSGGRTVLEAAAMFRPAVVVCAHEREELHAPVPGMTWLGHHSTVTDSQVSQAVAWLIQNPGEREARGRRARAAVDPVRATVELARMIDDLARG